MALTMTTTQTTTVELKPRLKQKLLTELRAYAADRAALKEIEARMDARKEVIGGLREEAGVTSLALEGYRVAHVTNIRTSLNKLKLMEMGVTTDMLEAATESKPGRPYTKITIPGEKSYSED